MWEDMLWSVGRGDAFMYKEYSGKFLGDASYYSATLKSLRPTALTCLNCSSAVFSGILWRWDIWSHQV